jgi:ATP-binding cassette, subfamily C, bacterial PrsD
MIKFLGGVPGSPLSNTFVDTKRAFYIVALLSAALNILLLGGSIFMMMVYDMVLPSGSLPTLVGLLFLIIIVYIFQGFFDVARSRILADIGASMDLKLASWVHHAISRNALYSRTDGDGLQPMRDIEQIRGFLSGGGPAALIDLPWVIFFVAILFLMHAWLGITILCGALVLTVLTVMTERMSHDRMQELSRSVSHRNAMAEANRRHSADATALGMSGRLSERWTTACSNALESQQRLADIAGTLGATSKMMRIFLQSVMLSVGAWIVIRGEATGGIIFASAILGSRALSPVEQVIANWRGFLGARQGWKRLDAFLTKFPEDKRERTALPAPSETLSVEGLSLVPPGANKPSVIRTTFALSKGDAVGIIGPSGSGKTTLIRGLLGIWPAAEGTVRLDGAAIDQWNRDALGQYIGYLPQNVELLNGTVAQNIARFESGAQSDVIVAAAKAAGVHDLILKLPNGYETNVDADGAALSAGQRQRVALARALYCNPFLIVLDEPNSNLDSEGEEALAQSIKAVRARGGIVVLVAHRPAVLAEVNLVLVMRDGMAKAFGPRDEVLEKVMGRPKPAANSQGNNPNGSNPQGVTVLGAASGASGNGVVSTKVLRPARG